MTATPAALRRLVLREGARLTAVGAPAGLVLAAALSRLVGGVLYGLPPLGPVTFVCVPGLLAAATAVACLIPAQRAIALDPVSVLRG
jgi:putative ABC transport system permease protein